MERFSNILYAFVRLQDSWWANHTTGLPRSFSFSRMIMPMSVIAFGRCARRHPLAGVFVYIQKRRGSLYFSLIPTSGLRIASTPR